MDFTERANCIDLTQNITKFNNKEMGRIKVLIWKEEKEKELNTISRDQNLTFRLSYCLRHPRACQNTELDFQHQLPVNANPEAMIWINQLGSDPSREKPVLSFSPAGLRPL